MLVGQTGANQQRANCQGLTESLKKLLTANL
jgi:hypothetical protein